MCVRFIFAEETTRYVSRKPLLRLWDLEISAEGAFWIVFTLNSLLNPASSLRPSPIHDVVTYFTLWWLDVLVEYESSDLIVSIDYAKAFDVVCHEKPHLRLENMVGSFLKWVRAFLSRQSFQVRFGDWLLRSAPNFHWCAIRKYPRSSFAPQVLDIFPMAF